MNHNINEEKTENPTEHRIKKFQKKGKTKYSRELNSLLILSVGFLSLWCYRNSIILVLSKIMSSSFIFNKNSILENTNTLSEILIYFKNILFIFLPFLIFLLITTIVPQIFFSGIILNFKSLEFNFVKMNPFYGLKRIFSLQIIVEFFKIILKLFIVSSISFWYLWLYFSKILFLINGNHISSLFYGCNIIVSCCVLVILGLIPMVVFDVFWQQFTYYKKLKMTHQEVKDEWKEKEGNPSIKNRIRQEMKASVRRRMISDVPKADVVITNPIHYSVALQYDENKMNAPKVVAKGIGVIAIKIQNLAIKNNVSVVSAPSLARSLYRYSEIGQYIPGPLYKAVAEVLAWVWKVRKWKKEGGVFPEKPKNILVPSESTFKGKNKTND